MFWLMRSTLALVVSVAFLASAGAASAEGIGQLDRLPLPRSALGGGSAALRLAPDSGLVSNASAAQDAGAGFTAADLANDGRITGYQLDYALPNATVPQQRPELLGVRTIAELYRDPVKATRGLAFWRGVTRKRSGPQANGITVTVSPFRATVGGGAFAFELTYRHTGQPLYYVSDIVFRSGRLLGAVFVSATDHVGLRARTLRLADTLASRINRVPAG
jgi:hypothetical protein